MNNILRSPRKHQLKKDEILDRDERLLLWNNIVLINNIYVRNPTDKNGFYSYPCLFKNYINNETINVQFTIDINDNFRKLKEIQANINCFIIIPEFVFNYFVNKNSLNYEYIKILNEENPK